MPTNRSHFRNVLFFDANNPDGEALGGLVQNGSITERNFLDMLTILLIVDSPIRVQERGSAHVVTRTNNLLNPATYNIYCDGQITLTDEPWVFRLISFDVSGRDNGFREAVRARDSRCVVTGTVNRRAPVDWSFFEAAHIFPLEKENLWIDWGYSRWVTDMGGAVGISKINSPQNGLLLRSDIHKDFDQYLLGINPDDDYKIVMFTVDLLGIDGKHLDEVCLKEEDPHRVSDNLLRWHFRQCILGNMRGAGEPILECDFPTGTDMISEIRTGPYAQERFEMELAARLRGIASR